MRKKIVKVIVLNQNENCDISELWDFFHTKGEVNSLTVAFKVSLSTSC